MTNHWADIKHADVIVVMGGNAAEAHPCGFKWVVEAKAHNNARLVVIDPRFTRTASVADIYCPIRPGTDIAFLNAVTKYLLDNDKLQWEYVKAYTNCAYIVKDGFEFHDGLFTGYDEDKRDYDKTTWEYEIGPDGYAVMDPTMQHPRSVMQLLRKHVEPYTPELIERICGSPQAKFQQICELIATTSAPDKVMTSLYALGWTHHSKGSQNIRAMTIVQMLLGNIGMLGGGMNALRGHSNIQGLTDLGLDEQPHARLHEPADGQGAVARHLYEHEALQAAAAWPDQLLAELQQVLRLLPKGVLWSRSHRGERLGVRLAAQA